MRQTFQLPLAVILLTAGLSGSAATARLTYRAWGGARVGMTERQLQRAVGPLKKDEALPGGECHYAAPARGPKGIAYMIERGRVQRIDVQSGVTATAEGVRIGDTEQRVKSVYGRRVKVAVHPYDEHGHYLTVRPTGADRGYLLIFETDGKKVISFRSGKGEYVQYIEGCA